MNLFKLINLMNNDNTQLSYYHVKKVSLVLKEFYNWISGYLLLELKLKNELRNILLEG